MRSLASGEYAGKPIISHPFASEPVSVLEASCGQQLLQFGLKLALEHLSSIVSSLPPCVFGHRLIRTIPAHVYIGVQVPSPPTNTWSKMISSVTPHSPCKLALSDKCNRQ